MEQLPNQLKFKIWPIFYSKSMALPTSRLLMLIGSTTSSSNKMSLKHDTPDATITSVPSVRIQKSSRSGLTVYKSLSYSIRLHLMISTTLMRLDMQ